MSCCSAEQARAVLKVMIRGQILRDDFEDFRTVACIAIRAVAGAHMITTSSGQLLRFRLFSLEEGQKVN